MNYLRMFLVIVVAIAMVETHAQVARAAGGSDEAEAECMPPSPASPFETISAGRCITYSNTSLNGGGNTATVAPGASVSISFDYDVDFTNCTDFCPGCIQQLYYGIRDEFSTCYTGNFQQNTGGSVNDNFTAPAAPGYYYVTHHSSLQFSCVTRNHNACDPGFALLIVDSVPALNASATASGTSCQGCSDGGVDVTVSGGKAPYSFDWSNGETTEDLSGVPAGTYTVTVEDRCGVCSVELTVTVSDPFGLDIKPGSCPNSFNRRSHGVLPVGLLDTGGFDVTQVDLSSLQISRADGVGGSVGPNEGPPGPHSVFDDVGTPFSGGQCDCDEATGDGLTDLSMKFRTDDVVEALELDEFAPGALVELTVSGNLLDGTPFNASDCVRLVPPGTPPGRLLVAAGAVDRWINAGPLDLQLDGGGFDAFERTYPLSTAVTITAPPSVTAEVFFHWVIDGIRQTSGLRTITLVITQEQHQANAIYRLPSLGDVRPKRQGTGIGIQP